MKRNKVGHLIRTAVLLLLPLGAGAQAPAPRHSAEVAWGVSVPLGTGYPDKTGAAAFSLRYSTASHSGGRRSLSVAWDPYGRQRGVRRSLRRRRCNGYAERTRQQNPHHGHAAVVHARWAHKSVATISAPVSAPSGPGSILPGRRSTPRRPTAGAWVPRPRSARIYPRRGGSLPRRAGGLPLRFQPVEGRRSKRPARVYPSIGVGLNFLKPRAQRPMHPNSEPQEGQGPPKPKRPDEPQVSADCPGDGHRKKLMT